MMTKRPREFVDKDHEVMDAYHDVCERYDGRNAKKVKQQLRTLIEEDQDFLDSYSFLHDILLDEGQASDAEQVLNEAYERAKKLITDKKGQWPDRLEWGWLENRHVIRAILRKALWSWDKNETEAALELLRKLLRANPNDNIAARAYILAIRTNMTFQEFEGRFERDGFYDTEMMSWFDREYKKFPDEFDWWEKAIKEQE